MFDNKLYSITLFPKPERSELDILSQINVERYADVKLTSKLVPKPFCSHFTLHQTAIYLQDLKGISYRQALTEICQASFCSSEPAGTELDKLCQSLIEANTDNIEFIATQIPNRFRSYLSLHEMGLYLQISKG